MRTRLRHLWDVLTTGYWFVPGLMTLAAAAAAFLLLFTDRRMIGSGVHCSKDADSFAAAFSMADSPERRCARNHKKRKILLAP
jgi:hypothetical protein